MSLLSNAARVAMLPAAGAGPWAAVLVPVIAYALIQREVSLSVSLR